MLPCFPTSLSLPFYIPPAFYSTISSVSLLASQLPTCLFFPVSSYLLGYIPLSPPVSYPVYISFHPLLSFTCLFLSTKLSTISPCIPFFVCLHRRLNTGLSSYPFACVSLFTYLPRCLCHHVYYSLPPVSVSCPTLLAYLSPALPSSPLSSASPLKGISARLQYRLP